LKLLLEPLSLFLSCKNQRRTFPDFKASDDIFVLPQVVGHVLDEDDLKFVPNSPIFNISHTSGARMLTIPTHQGPML
jgi:hypothetical protein